MRKKARLSRKCLSLLTALSMNVSAISICSFINTNDIAIAASSADTRVRVDLNANDGRKSSYTDNVNNWIVAGDTPTATFEGLSFKLSNGGSSGEGIRAVNCKILQKSDGSTPTMTMDGVTISDCDSNGVIKLEISGLSEGQHSLTTWHSCVDNANISSMSVSINGKTTATNIKGVTRVSNDDDAGKSYSTFNVSSGSTVTVLISPEGNGTVNNAFLNAFEIDGADPFNSISRTTPKDYEKHLNIEDGLSWTAGNNAKSHDVYIGTDFDSVFYATKSSDEFKGNQTATTFSLDDSYSSLQTYYWRVDEVSDNGTVKGDVYQFNVNRLAFPSAEGYGRFARGGRGGRVVEVTNLNDSGEGSLRQAIEVEKGARTIVFRVGGVIELKSRLIIPDDGGDVYVAGQTAPGDGITLINYDFGALGSDDVIIRNVRVRVGDMNGSSSGGMGLGSCNNSIIDHCSISWATDEGFSSRSANNISFQWNIIGESLHDSVHYDSSRTGTETHAFAASISGYVGSFHHNLLIDCTGRNWSLAGGMEQDAVTYGGYLDIRNNVVYNWKDRTTDGGVRRLNFVNNLYKAGASSDTSLHVVSLDGNELGTNDMQKMYVSGNVMKDYSGKTILAATDDAWAMGKAKSGGKNSTNSDVKSDTPFFDSYVNTQSAEDAYKSIISNVGAGFGNSGLDYIDSRYIKEVSEGTYTYSGSKQGLKGIIDSQNDVGGYPNSSNFSGGTAPTDTDHDGIPDDWESKHGLNANDSSDGSIATLSADDYTNLEMYLNELAGDTVVFNAEKSTISAYNQIEAENFNEQSGVKNEDCTEGGQNVGYIESGDYIVFKNIDFEDGAKSFISRISGNGGTIELCLDGLNGKVIGTCDIVSTFGWQNWTDMTYNIEETTGVHDLYLKFSGDSDSYLYNINYFTFSKDEYIAPTTVLDIMKGNANCDADVNIADVVAIRRCIVNSSKYPLTAQGILNGDVQGNSDGINAQDAVAIQMYILGLITEFPS